MADDAVLCELVWSMKFPAIREKNREIFDFWPNWWATASITICISGVCEKIPYATEQGNNSRNQENPFPRTGNIHAVLRPNPTSPRIHSKKQIKQIAASIRSLGFLNPPITDDADIILAGYARSAPFDRINLVPGRSYASAGKEVSSMI